MALVSFKIHIYRSMISNQGSAGGGQMDMASQMMPVDPVGHDAVTRGAPEIRKLHLLWYERGASFSFVYNNIDLEISKFHIVVKHNSMVSGHKISKLDLLNNPTQELWSSQTARSYILVQPSF